MTEFKTAQNLADQIIDRAKTGLEKYGVTVDRDDLKFEEWCQHAIEEALDLAHYLQRLKESVPKDLISKDLL